MKPQLPTDEEDRLKALYSYQLLDTESEQEYDDIAMLAAQICGTPIANISLIDKNRQWLKSTVGFEEREMPREIAFCSYTIDNRDGRSMVVNDTLEDERFSQNPLVTGDPNIRFYAGAPLITPDNFALGALCVIDREPRQITDEQLKALEALARQVTLKFELRRTSSLLKSANEELQNLSLTDDLTGLYNRRGFFFHAEQQLKLFRSRKSEDEGLWLMMIDLDGLKKINDTYGHEEGSFAIKKAGELLRGNLRDADVVARFGGDEFVAMMINVADSGSDKIHDRIETSFAAYNKTNEKPYKVAASCGMTEIRFDDDSSIEEIIREADALMYIQKRKRKAERT